RIGRGGRADRRGRGRPAASRSARGRKARRCGQRARGRRGLPCLSSRALRLARDLCPRRRAGIAQGGRDRGLVGPHPRRGAGDGGAQSRPEIAYSGADCRDRGDRANAVRARVCLPTDPSDLVLSRRRSRRVKARSSTRRASAAASGPSFETPRLRAAFRMRFPEGQTKGAQVTPRFSSPIKSFCSRTTPMSRFYITTAIPYANGAPHIGHAYERIATDAIQRFMRLDGRETLFVTGMDEHGLKVQQAAAREGVTPQAFVDKVAAEFEAMGEMLNARADDIVRTTQARHIRASQAIWERMAANGDIYLSKYTGWYSVRDEAYFDESELTDRPDGTRLAPSGAPVEWVEEESYFFRLSQYADKLLAHYAAHPDFVTPEK